MKIGTDEAVTAAKGMRILHLAKENRLEAMIVTILLYSTGVLDKAWTYGAGVC